MHASPRRRRREGPTPGRRSSQSERRLGGSASRSAPAPTAPRRMPPRRTRRARPYGQKGARGREGSAAGSRGRGLAERRRGSRSRCREPRARPLSSPALPSSSQLRRRQAKAAAAAYRSLSRFRCGSLSLHARGWLPRLALTALSLPAAAAAAAWLARCACTLPRCHPRCCICMGAAASQLVACGSLVLCPHGSARGPLARIARSSCSLSPLRSSSHEMAMRSERAAQADSARQPRR